MNTDKIRIPAFVKNDVDLLRFLGRIEKRNQRYPDWRQVYYDCAGMCRYPIDNNGTICGHTEDLEFHECWGDTDLKYIVLVCNYHHFSIHQGIVNPRHYKSKLQLDVELEMKLAGGLSEWQNKFNVIFREVSYDFENDTGKHKDDILVSEDS